MIFSPYFFFRRKSKQKELALVTILQKIDLLLYFLDWGFILMPIRQASK